MSGKIRRCSADHTYTLSLQCPVCGRPTAIAHPARFSVQDRFGLFRRMAKNRNA
ncbi:RNA-protein complex protein Nop10 [Methanoregula sp.]|uniref:RNA-protein complex protein Nop10 n=1 Tax=Methanoregula sp. TaxID=2052170 RepID=UPI002C9076B3|nr:RNA-protein complex protein Nop10 [Methanoregula sp.]HVP97170.1 RNA-protein complex protein Nop10 [Methanoregula sp.]